MRPEDLDRIRGLPLFSALQPECFEQLMEPSFLQRFPAAVELVREGDPADFLYVIVDGAVELYAHANGRESSLLIATPVSTFILAAVLRDAVYLMSARTLEASRLLMIPAEVVRASIASDSAFAVAMIDELARAFRSVIKLAKNHKLRTGVERLANYLLQLDAEKDGCADLVLPIEKRLLASLLGMTPENLSRAFATLRPYGVQVEGSLIRLTRIEDLRTLAKTTPLIDDPRI
ncbi:MAG: cyclic nucleotide-binding domain-containing protein [Rhodospirillaceae bacterium]|nr:cyclic nucleotide-binding domain-containing protein [Rhodospirillaceae bacterium]